MKAFEKNFPNGLDNVVDFASVGDSSMEDFDKSTKPARRSIPAKPRAGRPEMKRSLSARVLSARSSLAGRIGHIIKSGKEDNGTILRKILAVLGLIVATTCIITFVAAFFVVERIKSKSNFRLRSDSDSLAEKRERYEEIIKRTVPSIDEWLENNIERDVLPVVYSRPGVNVQADCFDTWFNGFSEIMPVITPEEVEYHLDAFGLLYYPSIVDFFQAGLGSPTSTQTLLEGSRDAVKNSPILSKMSCVALQYLPGGENDFSTTLVAYRREIKDLIGKAFVLEILTTSVMKDHNSLAGVIQSMGGPQKSKFLDFIHDKRTSAFYTDKYDGVLSSLEINLERLSSNSQQDAQSNMKTLQTNILEAVKVDIDRGLTKNAKVGISLAAVLGAGKVPGKNWVDAYISWNMAFILGYGLPSMIYEFVIPSIAGDMTTNNGDRFIHARTISHALTLMSFNDDWMPLLRVRSSPELAIEMGDINVEMVRLPPVSKQNAIDMLFELCGNGRLCASKFRTISGTFPHDDWMSDEEYKLYIGFVIWVTLIVTGFGMEGFVLSGLKMSSSSCIDDVESNIKDHHRWWSPKIQLLWQFSQFLFPILAIVSFGLATHGNYLSILTTAIGLWKFGFPETLSCLSAAIFCRKEKGSKLVSRQLLMRLENLLNGCGTVIHHTSASLVIAFVLVGAITASRDVSDPILILFMQHLFVLLRYVNRFSYIVITIVLEVWFEWAVISHFENLCANHTAAAIAGMTMLVAHWMYLLAGGLNLLSGLLFPDGTNVAGIATRKTPITNRRRSGIINLSKKKEGSAKTLVMFEDPSDGSTGS